MKLPKGFTLIEILIVVAMLGLLTTMVSFTFRSSQAKARDAQRKSDLSQYRNALEAFANGHDGLYPSHLTTAVPADSICNANELNLGTSCAKDPKDGEGSFRYYYLTDGTGGSPATFTATKYVLYAYLERSADYWVVCSSGTNKSKSSAGTLADCP